LPETSNLTILYVEDEPELREHVAFALTLHFENVLTAINGREALELFKINRPDVVISDIRMPIMDGLELTAELKRNFPDVPVILCTAFTDTAYLLRAIELGVAAYIPKPIDTARMLDAVNRAVLPILQRREIQRLKSEAIKTNGLLSGNSPAMLALREQITRAAESDYAVVVRGENGTGKGMVAELLHSMSRRKKKRLHTIECRSRSAEQLELDLFGRTPGRGRPSPHRDSGILKEINGGTLALKSPELLPVSLQERILSLLESGSYSPAAGIESIECDVRVIALTTADLGEEALQGRFSGSLWLRLSDVVLNIPPLRDRSEDIPEFCSNFIAQAADDLGRNSPMLTPEALQLLQAEQWPGNFRELKQRLRRLLVQAGDIITAAEVRASGVDAVGSVGAKDVGAKDFLPLQSCKLSDLERWAIERAIHTTGGKKMQAAELLGISYNAFKEKMRRYGIS
jgi:DNA-binding NtrC family response regulator